jgi:hypothetical protein
MGRLSDQISAELESTEATSTEDASPKEEVKEEKPGTDTTNSAPSSEGEKSPAVVDEKKEEGGEPGNDTSETKATEPKTETKTEAKSPTAPQSFNTKDWVLKSDGEEYEPKSVQELKTLAQKGLTSDKRFREAAQKEKAVQEFTSAFEQSPIETVENFYIHKAGDPNRGLAMLRNAMIDYLRPWAEVHDKPEDLARYEEKQRLDRERKAWEAEKARIKSEQENQVEKQAQENYTHEIISAFKAAGLEDNQTNVRKVAKILQESIEYELGVTPADAVAQVKNEIESAKTARASQPLSIDELLSDPVKAAEIEKKLIAKKAPPSTPPFPSTPNKGEEKKEPQERATRKPQIQTKRNFHESIVEAAIHG